MTPNDRAFITVAKELRQLEVAVMYGEICLQIRDRVKEADARRYNELTTADLAKDLEPTMNADPRIATLIPFVQALGGSFEGLDTWIDQAHDRIAINRKLVDAYTAGEDVVQTRLSLSRDQ